MYQAQILFVSPFLSKLDLLFSLKLAPSEHYNPPTTLWPLKCWPALPADSRGVLTDFFFPATCLGNAKEDKRIHIICCIDHGISSRASDSQQLSLASRWCLLPQSSPSILGSSWNTSQNTWVLAYILSELMHFARWTHSLLELCHLPSWNCISTNKSR